MSSEADTDRLRWARIFALRTLHEATLSDLLGARNYAAKQLLRERNDLLRERYSTLTLIICAVSLSHTRHLFVTGGRYLAAPSSSFPRPILSHRVTPTHSSHILSHSLGLFYRFELVTPVVNRLDIIQERYDSLYIFKSFESHLCAVFTPANGRRVHPD
jgi:hypothetical protein